MNKQQKEIVKKINKAFSKLEVLNNIKWSAYRDKLFNINKEHEKKHRRGDWYNCHSDYASVSDCAKLFAVSHIAESLLKPNKWNIKDLISINESCLLAQSLVNNFKKEILEALKDENIKELSELCYISLVDWDHYQKYTANRKAAA